MIKKIAVIISLSLTLPLLLSGSHFVYAATSGAGNNGEVTPSVLTVILSGDEKKFEEDHWVSRDVTGGVYDFNAFKEYKNGDSVELDGKALAGSNDYLFNLAFKREGLGTINFEFKQFRKFYDGTGGYFSLFIPTAKSPKTFFEINKDLFLDIGDIKIEGVFSKEESTKCTFSYEREYKQGAKSMITWNSVVSAAPATVYTRKIYPNFLYIDEIVDKLDLKLEHTVSGIDLSVEQTWESVKNNYRGNIGQTFTLSTGALTSVKDLYQKLDSDIYTTTLRASKELNDKVFFSVGLINNYYREHTRRVITDTSTDNHPDDPANVQQDIATLLSKLSVSLMEDLLMDMTFRWEYVVKDADALYNRSGGPTSTTIIEVADIDVFEPENRLAESINFKYDRFRDVIFYAGGEFEQQWRDLKEVSISTGTGESASNTWSRDSSIKSYNYGYTLGSKWYPIQKVDINTEFKYSYDFRHYFNDHNTGDVVSGYQGFLNSLSYTRYKPIVMLNFKPFRWLACNFRYAFDTTIYGTTTKLSNATLLAQYTANIYSTGVTLTPRDNLYMTCFYQYKEASTQTQANGNGKTIIQLPTYNANVRALSTSISYSPAKDITFRGGYSFSSADNFNNFAVTGLPLGLDNFSQDASIGFEKKIQRDYTVGFKYDFMQYYETSNVGIDNYEAHLFLADLKMKF